MNRSAAAIHGPRERAALVGLATRATRHADPERPLEELAGLARAAGAAVVLTAVQDRPSPDPATLIGRGKAEALAAACAEAGATLVIVDNPLSPAQARNLEKIVDRRVIDRTALILDIFAQRARTREGQLQVELAQLEYLLPRLAGSGTALSRLGGGIGTRGPGETKLETDRRRIRRRIASLKAAIADVERRRAYLRGRRRRSEVPVVALVGYTNAGKTTLFNRLTGASAAASDALFVTLDPVVRRVKLAGQRQVLVSDTVGFIDRLPHELVAAFHATLEEVVHADLLVHVIDGAAPDLERRVRAVAAVLQEVGAGDVPVIEAVNKIDLVSPEDRRALELLHPGALGVSARTGAGVAELTAAVLGRLSAGSARVTLRFATDREDDRRRLADLHRVAHVVREVVDGSAVSVEAEIPRRWVGRFVRHGVPA
jgi:GTP-binding protein HflX